MAADISLHELNRARSEMRAGIVSLSAILACVGQSSAAQSALLFDRYVFLSTGTLRFFVNGSQTLRLCRMLVGLLVIPPFLTILYNLCVFGDCGLILVK